MTIEVADTFIQSICNTTRDDCLRSSLAGYLDRLERGDKIKFSYYSKRSGDYIKVYRYEQGVWKYRLIDILEVPWYESTHNSVT